jgi:carbonic anhydrase/acetyltransferase-like protein (isoleucine patch superfamily)
MAIILPYAGIRPRIHPTAFIAPNATVIGNVTIGEESSVWFGAVIRGDEPEFEIRVGARTSVQDNVVIHVSRQGATIIGDDVTIGHGAILESCTVGDSALIGMNAVILQRATVGGQALIAAGAVVSGGAQIPPRTMAAGTPAAVKKQLEGESLRWVSTSAAHYVELSRSYLAQGIGWVRGHGQTGETG